MVWKNPWYDPDKAHHTPVGFRNPEPTTRAPNALKRWRAQRKAQNLPRLPAQGYNGFQARWWQKADLTRPGDGIWWLGHAMLLLRLNGHYILTDPVFSKRASPLSFYGPSRKTPPPLNISELPRLDAVVISHNHYDHLDAGTLRRIKKRFPDAHYFVPLGLKAWLRRRGIVKISELDWWQDNTLAGITFTCVPARHWSMRTFWNRNRSLWCGWVISINNVRFWFSGDSGMSQSLDQIGQRLGPLTAAALPIGAYAPRWFMGDSHMDPQSAVALWQALGKPLAIPIHWGVFELADEALDEPPAELTRALEQAGESPTIKFCARRIGEFVPLSEIR